MILSDDEIKERIESPLNLLNRLKNSLQRTINPSSGSANIVSLPPKSSDIIENLEDKIAKSSVRSKATSIMVSAMSELQSRIPEIQKPEKLATIAHEMSKIISNQDAGGGVHGIHSQIIVYAPQVQNIENYDVVEVNE